MPVGARARLAIPVEVQLSTPLLGARTGGVTRMWRGSVARAAAVSSPQPTESMSDFEKAALAILDVVGPMILSAETPEDLKDLLDDAAMTDVIENPPLALVGSAVDVIKSSIDGGPPRDAIVALGRTVAQRVELGIRLAVMAHDDAIAIAAHPGTSWAKSLLFGGRDTRSLITDPSLPIGLRQVFLSTQRSAPALFALLYIRRSTPTSKLVRRMHAVSPWLIRELGGYWHNGQYDVARLMAGLDGATKTKLEVPMSDWIDFAAAEREASERRARIDHGFRES